MLQYPQIHQTLIIMVINVIRENPCFFRVIRGLYLLLSCAESNSLSNYELTMNNLKKINYINKKHDWMIWSITLCSKFFIPMYYSLFIVNYSLPLRSPEYFLFCAPAHKNSQQ